MQLRRILAKHRIIAVIGICLCLALSRANAQTEYLVTLDPATGSFTKIKVLSGVNWILPNFFAYCESTHTYTFCGSANQADFYLYTIDAITGKVISSPPFAYAWTARESLYNLAYSNQDQKLYGLLGDKSSKTTSFVSLDPATARYSVINTQPTSAYFSTDPAIIDKNNHYVVVRYDSSSQPYLYTLDVANGSVLYKFPVPAIGQITYDYARDRIIALHTGKDTVELISIDARTGAFSTLCADMPVGGYVALAGSYAYNAPLHRYTFVGIDELKNPVLLTANANGTIDHQCAFPFVSNTGNNVIGFQYDNALGKMFAIHWEANTDKASANGFLMYPNPFSTEATIILKKAFVAVEVLIFASDGRLAGKVRSGNTDAVMLERNGLSAGVYFIRVYGDGNLLGTAKLFAE